MLFDTVLFGPTLPHLLPWRLGSTEMLIVCKLLRESFRFFPFLSFPALMLINPFMGVLLFLLEAIE